MAALSIVRFPHPLLKQPTRAVERIDERIRRVVDALIETMRKHPRCVGLAAPQVGSDLRIAVMDSTAHPKATTTQGLVVLINPELEVAGESVIQREGCLSIPDFTANVARASHVRVKSFDQYGSLREVWFEGFEAIVAQHEIDHLEGKLFLDRVANVKTDVFRRKTY